MHKYYHSDSNDFTGIFQRLNQQDYKFTITTPAAYQGQVWQLVTLRSHLDHRLEAAVHKQILTVRGRLNYSGNWLLVEEISN